MSSAGVSDDARTVLQRAEAVAEYGDSACLVIDATVAVGLARDALELHALRSLIAGLPEDDWAPFDWAVFSVAQEAARVAL